MAKTLRIVALVAVVLTGLLVGASPARAATFAGTVSGTGGEGLFVRPGPSQDSGAPITKLAEGTFVTIDCYRAGQVVAGYWYTGDTWQHITSPVVGWVTDTYLNTGHNGPLPGEPACTTTTPTKPNPFYNRTKAKNWALAMGDQPYDHAQAAGCTWFVSRALWNGGFPKSATWTDKGSHGTLRRLPGTATAWVADKFVAYLRSRFPVANYRLDFKTSAVPQAQIGDVIAYDWEGDGHVDHVAFVVNIGKNQYPDVAEWGVSGSRRTPYKKRGWSWSELSHNWMSKVYPKGRATLIHIRGGS